MGLNVSQLKALIVEPALLYIAGAIPALNSQWAVNQVTGTAGAESLWADLEQIPNGPAIGLWQMEPATHDSLWTNFLRYNAKLAILVSDLVSVRYEYDNFPPAEEMIGNLYYAAAMCRIRYWDSPAPAPAWNDAIGCANYHKTVYNTALGSADAEKNVTYFQTAISS